MNGDIGRTIAGRMEDARYWRGGENILCAMVETVYLNGEVGYAWIYPASHYYEMNCKKIGEFVV